MNVEEFRTYCLSKKGTSESLPFGGSILVFKVANKIFALTDLELFESINLKCDPEKAQELRNTYSSVLPGFHMNKKHWNTILINLEVNDYLVRQWIDESYLLVRGSLPKKLQNDIESFLEF